LPVSGLLQGLLLQPCCPRCRRPAGHRSLCLPCRRQLLLDAGGLQGQLPLPWWSLGPYQGAWRQELLRLKRQPEQRLVEGLARQLLTLLPDLGVPLLIVAIPPRRKGRCDLPQALARAVARQGGHRLLAALDRQRACLGQHHLNRRQRLGNLQQVFRCLHPAGGQLQPLLLVDDILTTGSTAAAAMACLEGGGHGLLGLACLARTPRRDEGADPMT